MSNSWLTPGRLVVGGTFALVAVVVLYVLASLWGIRQGYAEHIDRVEPRTARLLGVQEREEDLAAAFTRANAQLAELAYPANGDTAMTAAAMQQSVRNVMTEAGFTVSGSQILPERREGDLLELRLDVTAVGSIDALAQTLDDLRAARPLVIIESVTIKPGRVRRSSDGTPRAGEDRRPLSARFKMVSLRMLK